MRIHDTIANVEVYISVPESPNGLGLLYLTDIIGHKFINAQLLADQYAANGYLLVMPDLSYGDPVPLNADMATFSVLNWTQRKLGAKRRSRTHRRLWIQSSKIPGGPPQQVQVQGQDFVGPSSCLFVGGLLTHQQAVVSAAYCFGVKYTVRALGSVGIDAGYIAHPANITKGELGDVKGPLAVAATEIDYIFPVAHRRETEDKLPTLGVP